MWMSHPSVTGVVPVLGSAFYGGWDTLGWVVAAAPIGPLDLSYDWLDASAAAASAAASAASAAASAALVGAPADTAVAALLANPASATAIDLNSTYAATDGDPIFTSGFRSYDDTVPAGYSITAKVVGDPRIANVNWTHDGDDYLIHLMTGPTADPGNRALIALGTDTTGIGILISQKGAAQGIVIDQNATVSDALAFGFFGMQESTLAPLMYLQQRVNGAAPALVIESYGATIPAGQKAFLFKSTTAGGDIGWFEADTGILRWQKQAIFGNGLRVDVGITELRGGDLRVGTTTGATAQILLDKPVGGGQQIIFRAGGAARWSWSMKTEAESGGDTGGGLELLRYNDAGASVEPMLKLTRSTANVGIRSGSFGGGAGVVSIKNAVTAPTTSVSDGMVLYAVAGVLTIRSSAGAVVSLIQQAAIANPTDPATTQAAVISALSALRTIGLIAP